MPRFHAFIACACFGVLLVAETSAQTPAEKRRALQLVTIGTRFISANNPAEARKYCEQAIALDGESRAAADCLAAVVKAEGVAAAARARQLIAESKARAAVGEYPKAIDALATAAAAAGRSAQELEAIAAELASLKPPKSGGLLAGLWERATASWVLDVLFAAGVLVALYILLRAARWGRRWFRRLSVHQLLSTRWVMRPLDDETKLAVTELLADSMARLRRTMKDTVQIPTLLPLRPTLAPDLEPQVWLDFRINPPREVRDIEDDISLRIDQHVVELAATVGELQLKVGNVELGQVAKFLTSIKRWFDVGVPTVTGSVSREEKAVVIRLTRSGEGLDPVTIVSSTEDDSPMEAARLAAERAAYKLLHLLADPGSTSRQVDGLAARRQGISLLQRWCTAFPGEDRKAGLEKAAVNLRFARDSVVSKAELCELYLYEAIAHALLSDAADTARPSRRDRALELLRSVTDLADPNDEVQRLIRLQACYNHAILEHRQGSAQSIEAALEIYRRLFHDAEKISADDPAVDAIVLLARFGYVVAAASYTRDSRRRIDAAQVDDWINTAVTLHEQLVVANREQAPAEQRIADEILVQSHRAYAQLVLFKAQAILRMRLPGAQDQRSSHPAFEPELRLAAASLELVSRRQIPDVKLHEALALVHLLLADPKEAGRHARNGISAAGDESELLHYAAAWGALQEQDPGTAARMCLAFPTRGMSQFAQLCDGLLKQPLEDAAPHFSSPQLV